MIGAAIDSVQSVYKGIRARRRSDGGYTLTMGEGVVARITPVLGDYVVESAGGICHTVRCSKANPAMLAQELILCVEDGMRSQVA